MKRVLDIRLWFLVLGTVISAVTIGFLLQLARFEEMHLSSLIRVWGIALSSYAIPTLWFVWRGRVDPGKLGWLLVPMLGTILLQVSAVQIPRELSAWRQSGGASFLTDFINELPMQAFKFVTFFLIYSTISCAIMGLAQLGGLGIEWLIRNRAAQSRAS